MTVGERIQEFRKKNYMSQEELADRLDVSKQSVSKWETDKSLPNIEKIIRLCDIFEVSADSLLRGEDISQAVSDGVQMQGTEMPAQQDIENMESTPDVRKNGSQELLVYKILLGISIFVSVCLLMAVLHIVVYNNMGIDEKQTQDIVRVDRIYDQYTKADVEYVDENDNFVERTVWLDIKGVREGDWIFCYFDAEDGNKIRFKYSRDTCVTLILAFAIFLVISIILMIVLRRKRNFFKGNRTLIVFVLLITGMSFCACGGCGNHVTDDTSDGGTHVPVTGQFTEESLSSESDASYSDADEELYKEYKETGIFESCGAKIVFSVPEGYYSTGACDYDDVMFENFYSDDTMQHYNVFFSSLILYEDEADYGRTIYSEYRNIEPSAEVSLWKEEVVNGNTVVYVTMRDERDETVFSYVRAGVVLPDERVFEVTAKMLDCEGAFDFEVVRPFFENLEITLGK